MTESRWTHNVPEVEARHQADPHYAGRDLFDSTGQKSYWFCHTCLNPKPPGSPVWVGLLIDGRKPPVAVAAPKKRVPEQEPSMGAQP